MSSHIRAPAPKRRRRSSSTMRDAAKARHAFVVGDAVEVRSNEEGFRGAWFEATIAEQLAYGLYAVDYTALLADDGSGFLREVAEAVDIRPRPPAANVSDPQLRFDVHQLVEAFHNDGWWYGVVSALKEKEDEFVVAFPTSRELIELTAKHIRPRLDWDGEHWVQPHKMVVDNIPHYSSGSRVEVSRHTAMYGLAWFPATVLAVIGDLFYMVEYNYGHEGAGLITEILDAIFIRPYLFIKEAYVVKYAPFDDVEAFFHGGWTPGIILNLSSGKSDKYLVKIKMRKKDQELVLEFGTSSLRRRFVWVSGRWQQYFSKISNYRKSCLHIAEASDLTGTAARTKIRSTGSRAKKRKHDRSKVEDMLRVSSGDEPHNYDIVPDSSNDKPHNLEQFISQEEAVSDKNSRMLMLMPSSQDSIDKFLDHHISQNTFKETCDAAKYASMTRDSPATTDNEVSDVSVVDKTIQEVCLAATPEPPRIGRSKGKSAVPLGRCNIEHWKDGAKINETPLFERHSPMWATIKEMDVFRRFPQQPHFSPLGSYIAEFQDGMAIGLMLSFAACVESIKKLRLEDDTKLFEEKIATLDALEAHGFSVQAPRTCVDSLLRIKRNQIETFNLERKLKEKISEKEADSCQLDKSLLELEQSLKSIREKIADTSRQRSANDLEVSKLKKEAGEAQQFHQSAAQLYALEMAQLD